MKNTSRNGPLTNTPRKQSPKIAAKVFFMTVIAYYMSALMTTLGSVIDGFVIGHTMETADVGALSLTSPVWFITAFLYGVLAMGCQPFCAQELSKGEKEAASRIFSITLITGLALTVLLSSLILLFSGFIARLLGASPGTREYGPCRTYLLGAAIGLPGQALIVLLAVGINFEGGRRWLICSAAAMTVSDILLDLLVARIRGDMFMMGLSTSFSYYFGAAVLLFYYCGKRDSILKPKLCRVSPAMIGRIFWNGMPMGVSRLTTAFRSIYLNRLLSASATLVGLAAYNVQVQLNYLTNALFMGIAQTMSLMLCLYYTEEDKRGLRNTVLLALSYEALFGTIITLLLRTPGIMSWVSWFYLGENAEDARVIAEVAVNYFAIGLLGQAFSVLFANYLRSIGRTSLSKIVYVLCDAVLVVLFVSVRIGNLSAGSSDAVRIGSIFAAVSEAQLCMFAVIPALILLVNLYQKTRPASLWDAALMLPGGYGIPKGREPTDSPRTMEEVIAFSQNAYHFCLEQHVPKKEAFFISLAVEEMAGNVIIHGFHDRENCSLELRLIKKEDTMILRMRDNSYIFDPTRKLSDAATNSTDPFICIGIRIVMNRASRVTYTSTLKLNNLMICIDLPKEAQPVGENVDNSAP